nr:DUF917 family protein [uncultured Oscillibacter sp.]
MTRILNEKDIRAVLTGAAFFGAGGGGGLETGLSILADVVTQRGDISVKLIEASDIPEGGSAVAMTGLYTPGALAEKAQRFAREPGVAIAAMQHSAYMAGKRLEAILPMESGAVSSLIPMLCSLESGLPLVDADGCGRGVPGIDVTLFEKGGIPFSPAVICDDRGNAVRVYPYQATDGKAAANMCHYIAAAFNNVAGLGAWVTSPEDIGTKLVPGALSTAEKVGNAMLSASESGSCPCEALEKLLPLRVLASGKVTEKSNSAVVLKSEDGVTYFADMAKVTVRFRTAEETLAVCPELICAVDMEKGLPVANEEIAVGQKVRYYALAAPEQWQGHEECWKPYL